MLQIQKNSRQVPSNSVIVKEKNYSDLLYAWLQCNSERVSPTSTQRRITKKKCKFTEIENSLSRKLPDGTTYKPIERKTISKYFKHFINTGLVEDKGDEFYYLTVLDGEMATLIECETLSKLINTMQRHTISIYVYILNRFIANDYQNYIATLGNIKTYLGISTNTTSNNAVLTDSFEILKRLGLIDYKLKTEDDISTYTFFNIKNKLPTLA